MPRFSIAMLLCAFAALAGAQELMFRYIDRDGRVVYTDTPPPPDAKSVQQKKLGGNFIETSELPFALQYAQQRNPVTLYSGPCGPLCDQARALLNRRGVPYKDIDPSQPGELQKMREVTGDQQVPVLLVGGAITIKGFEEERWQGALDQAGYPKTPAVRTTALTKRDADKAAEPVAADKAAADKVAGRAATRSDAATPARSDQKGEPRTEGKPDSAPAARK